MDCAERPRSVTMRPYPDRHAAEAGIPSRQSPFLTKAFRAAPFTKSSPVVVATLTNARWLAGSDNVAGFTARHGRQRGSDVSSTTPQVDGGTVPHAREASHESVIKRVLNWLTAGYPKDLPPTERYALIALLHRTLTADEIQQVIAALPAHHSAALEDGVITKDEIRDMIAKAIEDAQRERPPEGVGTIGCCGLATRGERREGWIGAAISRQANVRVGVTPAFAREKQQAHSR